MRGVTIVLNLRDSGQVEGPAGSGGGGPIVVTAPGQLPGPTATTECVSFIVNVRL